MRLRRDGGLAGAYLVRLEAKNKKAAEAQALRMGPSDGQPLSLPTSTGRAAGPGDSVTSPRDGVQARRAASARTGSFQPGRTKWQV